MRLKCKRDASKYLTKGKIYNLTLIRAMAPGRNHSDDLYHMEWDCKENPEIHWYTVLDYFDTRPVELNPKIKVI